MSLSELAFVHLDITTATNSYALARCRDSCCPDDIQSQCDSNSTASGRPGLGSTIDGVLSPLGRRVTSLVSRFSERYLCKGPNAHIGRMLNSIDWSAPFCTYPFCPNNRRDSGVEPISPRRILPSPPTMQDVTHVLYAPYCQRCRRLYADALAQSNEFTAGCRKFLRDLRQNNGSVIMLTAYYCCALASFHPTVRQILVEADLIQGLQVALPFSRPSISRAVRVSAERAVISLAGDSCLPAVKEFDALEARLNSYYHMAASEVETKRLLPIGIQVTRNILNCLTQPHHLLLIASRISRSSVDQWLSLLSLYPGLRANLNGETVMRLWLSLARATDPIVIATYERFMCDIYNFMMWGWYYEEDLPSAAHGTRAKLLWPWDCLLMPLFRLRLEFPNVLQSIREPVLEAACLSFFSSRYTPSRLSWEAQDQIENLRRHILINKTAIERDYEAARPDPVYKLMLQIISPLFECLGMFYRERCLPRYPVARQFQRAIPHARLTELCTRVTEMLAGVRDYHDFVTVKPILEAISPRWDTRCVLEFRPRIQSLNWKESFRVNLDPDDSRYRLRCSGVAAYISTVLEKPEVEIYSTHRGLWRPDRIAWDYNQQCHCMHLITEHPYRDILWVAATELHSNTGYYEPIKLLLGPSELYLGRFRDTPLGQGMNRILVITRDELLHQGSKMQQTKERVIHVLCTPKDAGRTRTRVFWMTKAKLVDGITGEERANDLPVKDVFHLCRCWRAWGPDGYCERDYLEDIQLRPGYSDYKPLRNHCLVYQ